MEWLPDEPSRVLAVLGPTNTGKTHFAVERMLAHPSGLIGFPLRLLAREIYDRIVAEKGESTVALITGEERIWPDTARYHVATVEAMPTDLEPSFLAVDEIQLCADPERGHVFTDRLLRARGVDETMFLGADTMRPLLKQLVPEAHLITRPRFSTLSYTPPSRVSRLPRRSAVVAFTAPQVYALAEVVRRSRGGAAVVLGALSPRTRNAQVALYQAGEVDYLIATDAIGMGLNMDLGHVALASVEKFDGRERRRLRATEISQIAGRAGRHMQDGTFGTTIDVGELDARTVESVEGHSFPPLRHLRWRNADLDLGSLDGLLESLAAAPPVPCLERARHALDHVSLAMLARRPEIRERTTTTPGVRLLWSVCQIPDFRKTLNAAHLELLTTVFEQLAGGGRLRTDWVADQVARLEAIEGDIDALTARLAHIRTWTYVAHRADWLDDAVQWQERTRAVEDALSDALHEHLTQRFVDRRTQALLRGLQSDVQLARIADDGAIVIEGEHVGQVEGLRYRLEPEGSDVERRAMTTAARRVLGPEIRRRAKLLLAAGDDSFILDDDGFIQWRPDGCGPAAVARLLPGATALVPRLEVLVADRLGGPGRDAVRQRLGQWLDALLASVTLPLRRLQAAQLGGPGRGLAFLLVEGLGNVAITSAESLLTTLGAGDRARLTRLGVRFGVHHVYLSAMLKPRAIELRSRLFAIHHRARGITAPVPGRVALALDSGTPRGWAEAVGFAVLGEVALRVDIVERLAAQLRSLAREGPFDLAPDLLALTGLTRGELAGVVEVLGFAADGDKGYRRRRAGKTRRRERPQDERSRSESPFAALRSLGVGG